MSEPIIEVTRINLYGGFQDEGIIAKKVKINSCKYDKWLKGEEVDMTATEVRERREESLLKVATTMQSRNRFIIEVDYVRRFMDRMKKEEEDNKVYSEKRNQEL